MARDQPTKPLCWATETSIS